MNIIRYDIVGRDGGIVAILRVSFSWRKTKNWVREGRFSSRFRDMSMSARRGDQDTGKRIIIYYV
jgi:hypothetical protein